MDDGTGSIGCWHDQRKMLQKDSLQHRLERTVKEVVYGDRDTYLNNTSMSLEPDVNNQISELNKVCSIC